MQRFLIIAVFALGCDKRQKSTTSDDVLRRLDEYAKMMCTCKDRACADKVNDDLTKWSTDLAKNTPSSDRPDPEMAKRAADIMTKYTECMTKLMMVAAGQGGWNLPPVPKPATVDTLLKAARESAIQQNKTLALAKLEARYVGSTGALDPAFGTIEVAFGQHAEKDDPNRPIGAPVPESKDRLTECPTWTMTKDGWAGTSASCTTALAPPRCNLSQIWQRAIKEGAPAAALASMTLAPDGTGQTWTFTIVDEPRKIDIRKSFPDDCDPVVEHP